MSSMLYTMGTALDRAAEGGVRVSILVEGTWLEGLVAAVDGTGVVLEGPDHDHAVIRVERIAAVRVHTESPFPSSRRSESAVGLAAGPTVPTPRTA